MMVCLVFLIAVWTVAHAVTYKDYTGYQVINPVLKSSAETARLAEFLRHNNDFEILSPAGVLTRRNNEILATPDASVALQAFLRSEQVDYEITVHDLEMVLQQERGESIMWQQQKADYWATRSADKTPDFEIYRDYDEIIDVLKYFGQNFPELVKRHKIGKTYEGRSLELVKVSSNHSATDRPIVHINGNIHAREWATNAAVLYSINKLLHGSYDLLEKVDFHFVPLLNPDGYEFSRKTDRMWRKNRSPHFSEKQNKTCHGVDCNRNFPFMFGGEGTSGEPCAAQLYRGPKGASEYEVQAIIKHLEKNRNIHALLAVHTYSQFVMWPYGYKRGLTIDEQPPNVEELKSVSEKMAVAMENVNGTKYTAGNIVDLVGAAAGSSVDYAKHSGVRLSLAFELRPGSNDPLGFRLPESQIKGTAEELFAGIMTVAEALLE